MKLIYLPNKCVKCENDVVMESRQDGTMVACCTQCDFVLKFSKEEVESLLNK